MRVERRKSLENCIAKWVFWYVVPLGFVSDYKLLLPHTNKYATVAAAACLPLLLCYISEEAFSIFLHSPLQCFMTFLIKNSEYLLVDNNIEKHNSPFGTTSMFHQNISTHIVYTMCIVCLLSHIRMLVAKI